MSYIIEEKIRIGISACNFGSKVRWNNKGWDRVTPIGRERDAFIWTPVCPEVASGMGVSRPPIRLTGGNGDDVWEGKAKVKNKFGTDVTEQLLQGSTESMNQLQRAGVDAFVFMEGSPTCGVYRTTLKNKRLGKPPGVFGSLLLKEDIFLIPALDLDSPVKWWDWRRRLHAFVWLKNKEISSKAELYEIWHNYKFLCQEINRSIADGIGKDLAQMPKRLTNKYILEWKRDVLQLLRLPSTFNRIFGHMTKHYDYYRSHIDSGAHTWQDDIWKTMGKHDFVAVLQDIEKQVITQNSIALLTPVIYKQKR